MAANRMGGAQTAIGAGISSKIASCSNPVTAAQNPAPIKTAALRAVTALRRPKARASGIAISVITTG